MTKRHAIGAIKLIVSFALISYLVSIVDIGQTVSRLLTADLRYIAVALLLLVFQVAISAGKWKLILRSDAVHAPYLLLLKSNFIGNFFSLFLPSSFGGDVYRVISVTSVNRKLGKTTSSVLFDRATGLFALLSIALLAYVALPGRSYDWLALSIYFIGIGAFFYCTSDSIVNYFRNHRYGLVRKGSAIAASFQTYRNDYRTLWKVLCIALVFQFMIVVINQLYSSALGIDIPFSKLLVIVPLVYLTEVLPVSINGIGVRDSAFVYFFVLMGHTKEEGLAIALLVLSMRYVSGLIGGSVLLTSVLRGNFSFRSSEPG